MCHPSDNDDTGPDGGDAEKCWRGSCCWQVCLPAARWTMDFIFFSLSLWVETFKQNTIGKLLDVSFQVPRQSPLCQRMVRPGPTLQVCVKPEKVTKLPICQTQAKIKCKNLTCLASPRNVWLFSPRAAKLVKAESLVLLQDWREAGELVGFQLQNVECAWWWLWYLEG